MRSAVGSILAHVHLAVSIMNPFEREAFAVLNFSLTRNEDGAITQRTSTCGTFAEVEHAFAVARAAAVRELTRRRVQTHPPRTLELLDTEWGYDVREDTLVVSRYWVHDREPLALRA